MNHMSAENHIDPRKALLDLFGDMLLLGHTAAQPNQHFFSSGFLMGGLSDDSEHLLLGVFADRAGVVQGDIRFFDRVGKGAAHFFEHSHQFFAVVYVLCTAKALDQCTGRSSEPFP